MGLLGQCLLCLGNKSPAELMTGGWGPSFPYREVRKATKNFSQKRIIGHGGFGKVYKGVLRDGTKVAVKRFEQGSDQGLKEFQAEVDHFLSLRHENVVSLIGYCHENNEMILVYEYMEKGTLRSHLYGSDKPSLDWKQRLQICIAAASGLVYLHTVPENGIIHRDVKSTNILLDGNLVAKVSDFGLSKIGPGLDKTHVSTAVKGSFGYLDPEYFKTERLTKKSDVYSFGVVMLEVMCARLVVDKTLPSEMVSLSEWGLLMLNKGKLEDIVDPRISGTISPASLAVFVDTVEKCLADKGAMRPSMDDVVQSLEYALQLQDVNSATSTPIHPLVALGVGALESIGETTAEPGASNDPEKICKAEVCGNAEAGNDLHYLEENDPDDDDLSDILSMSQIFCQTIAEGEGR